MLELVLKLIRALLSSLYMLFEGVPALEALKSWFGDSGGMGRAGTSLLLLLAAAAVLGLLAFLVFLWLLRRRPSSLGGTLLLPEEKEPRAAGREGA